MKSANGACCFEAKAFVPFHSLSSHHCTVPMAQDPELRPCDFSGRIRDIGIGTLQPIARLALTSSSNRKESGIEYMFVLGETPLVKASQAYAMSPAPPLANSEPVECSGVTVSILHPSHPTIYLYRLYLSSSADFSLSISFYVSRNRSLHSLLVCRCGGAVPCLVDLRSRWCRVCLACLLVRWRRPILSRICNRGGAVWAKNQ